MMTTEVHHGFWKMQQEEALLEKGKVIRCTAALKDRRHQEKDPREHLLLVLDQSQISMPRQHQCSNKVRHLIAFRWLAKA
mmetsp:Transcript_10940/g.21063  ORF Transcript_10940/g.21063 Transcript_10940/m.21063 type:complete len:80 (+) Transcript_10940:148-387(+)